MGFVAEALSADSHADQGDALQRFGPQEFVSAVGGVHEQLSEQRHHAVVVADEVHLCTVGHRCHGCQGAFLHPDQQGTSGHVLIKDTWEMSALQSVKEA